MNAIEKLKEHKQEVDKRLSKYFHEKIEHAVKESESIEYIDELSEHIREYNLRGGKRIRPSFVVEGYRAVGGKDIDSIYDAALAVETMEGYLLIHDDMMDRDDLRRGGKTVHAIYREWFKNRFNENEKEAEHFGDTIAICAGDIVETFGTELIARSNFPAELKIKAIQKYNFIARYTGYGQVLDTIVEELPPEKVTEKHVLTVHKFKTSLYTITGPLQIGTILAGGTPEQLNIMEEYGKNLGVAFQIQDDILGIYADEKKLGKPVGSDLKEGKRTLLILKALEKGTPEQQQKLKSLLKKQDITPEEVKEAQDIIRDTGSLDYSKQLAVQYANKGIEAIKNTNFEQEGKEYMLGIADYLINREF